MIGVASLKKFKTQSELINDIKKSIDIARRPLTGTKFEINDKDSGIAYNIVVGKTIGYGSTSIIYEVYVSQDGGDRVQMIMKEFYPDNKESAHVLKRNEEHPCRLQFDLDNPRELKRLNKARNQFIDSFVKHKHIIEEDDALDGKIVKALTLLDDTDCLFALYETGNYKSIDSYILLDLDRTFDIVNQVCRTLENLHDSDIIYMDLKPGNILYDYESKEVSLFDLDAAVDLAKLSQITDFYMPSESAYIPPEFRNLSDINPRKHLFITPEVDLYMLGVTFFYLLMDRNPSDLEIENESILEESVKAKLSQKSKTKYISDDVSDMIVELLKESLAVFRYLTIEEFRERVEEIETAYNK